MNIYAFCSRAINCDTNSLFVIVKPEELKINQEKFILKIMKEKLEKKKNKINSCIIVLYINQNSHIVKQLRNLKEQCEFPEEPPLFETIENSQLQDLSSLPVEIVTSDSPRVGKSFYIDSKFGKEAEVFFPLGNVEQRLIERQTSLLKLILNSNNPAINSVLTGNMNAVFELYEIHDEKTFNSIKSFLFRLLILRNCKSFGCVGNKKLRIFIEVFSDYYRTCYKDFKFLKLFKNHHIEFKNHPDFYEKNKILDTKGLKKSTLEILNYLSLLKNGDINKKSSAPIFGFALGNKTLIFFPDDYDSLIKEYFMKKFPAKNLIPNFRQIGIFSDLLGCLIINLEKIPEISIETIKKNVKRFPFLKEIRGKFLSSYIDFVIKFTAFSYESILENQLEAAKHQKELAYKLDEKKKKKLLEEIKKKE